MGQIYDSEFIKYIPKEPAPVEPVIIEPGQPGSYIFAGTTVQSSGITMGGELPASSLKLAAILTEPDGNDMSVYSGYPALMGTWKSAGYAPVGSSVSLWLRIDTPASLSKTNLLGANHSSIKNCRYSSMDGGIIDCDFFYGKNWHPITVSNDSNEPHIQEIYDAIVSGQCGEIASFSG